MAKFWKESGQGVNTRGGRNFNDLTGREDMLEIVDISYNIGYNCHNEKVRGNGVSGGESL